MPEWRETNVPWRKITSQPEEQIANPAADYGTAGESKTSEHHEANASCKKKKNKQKKKKKETKAAQISDLAQSVDIQNNPESQVSIGPPVEQTDNGGEWENSKQVQTQVIEKQTQMQCVKERVVELQVSRGRQKCIADLLERLITERGEIQHVDELQDNGNAVKGFDQKVWDL